ncbi:hypothetical protein LJK87_38610 [Paenibacillus sp. P25]|nr:hypothetical protein LJK87_38610 [Paenibacillus sp. P25]
MLKLIMLQVDSAEAGREDKGDLYESLKSLYDGSLAPRKRMSVWEPDAGSPRSISYSAIRWPEA